MDQVWTGGSRRDQVSMDGLCYGLVSELRTGFSTAIVAFLWRPQLASLIPRYARKITSSLLDQSHDWSRVHHEVVT